MNTGITARFSLPLSTFLLDIHFDLPGKGVSALFGPSGCGKTTCLRWIAGLEKSATGFLAVNGKIWQDSSQNIFVPAHQRDIGFVFQEASLFPHLNVRLNLEFGMNKRASNSAKNVVDFRNIIELLGISSLLDRSPDKLSGGEKQRVAIARALLTQPSLLLLDEPLTALDQKRKSEILPYLEKLHDALSIPMIYVSHAPEEIAQLADHLVLLEQGRVIASGPLQETLARLDLPSTFTLDAGVVINTVVGAHEDNDHLTRLDFTGGQILVTRRMKAVGEKVRCRILARDVSLATQRHTDTSILNAVATRVVEIADTDNPAQVLVKLNAAGTPLLSRVTRRSMRHLALTPGMAIWAQIKTVALLE